MGVSVKEQDLLPVKPSIEKSKSKKKKLKSGKGKPTEEPQNIPDVPLVSEDKPSIKKSSGKKKKLKEKLSQEKPCEEHQNVPDEHVPSESEVKPSVKKRRNKKKKLKNGKEELGLEKPSEEHQNVPDEHVPLETEVKASVKKSKGKKKKLKSSKEEMDVEKPSEEPQNLPEEEVPLVSEVKQSAKKSTGKKKKLKSSKEELGLEKPNEEHQNGLDEHVPLEAEVKPSVKKRRGKKKKLKSGKEEHTSEEQNVPDDHGPLVCETKPSDKKSAGEKKKLKSGKEELSQEKSSEELKNVPDEQVPLVSEVSPSVEKSGGKKKKLMNGKAKQGLQTPKKESKHVPDEHVPLLYENITEGQVILGCIQEVQDCELKISLPYRLSGTVSIKKISKAYTELVEKMAEGESQDEEGRPLQDLYRPGQLVVTSVVSTDKIGARRKVNLSLMPQDVNSSLTAPLLEVGFVLPCAVASVENKGFIMDTGIASIRRAFLPHKAVQGAVPHSLQQPSTSSDTVDVGSVMRCKVTKISGGVKDSWDVVLSADPKALSEAILPVASTTNISLMIPGTAVDTTVSKVADYGLNITLAEYEGVVNRIHLKEPFDIIQNYKKGMKIRARVLYTVPAKKVVHFTLQNIYSESSQLDLKEGDIVENAVVFDSRPAGISLKLNDKYRGYCFLKDLPYGHQNPRNVKKAFPVGHKSECSIIRYCYMDRMFIVSLQKKFSYDKIEVGTKLKATVKCCKDRGILVALSKTVSGQIDYLMLDTQEENPEKKYPPGLVLNCRVLYVMPEKKIIKLTNKKGMVNSQLPIISEFDPNLIGTVSEGYIVSITPSGLLVAMYNNVKGFVPKSKATSEKVTSLDAIFTMGQVVKFCIMKVEPEAKRMTLTLSIDEDVEMAEEEEEEKEGETIGEKEETKEKAETADTTKKIDLKEEPENTDEGIVNFENKMENEAGTNDSTEKVEETEKKKGKKRKKEVECSMDTEITESEEGTVKKKKKDKKKRKKNVVDEVKDLELENDTDEEAGVSDTGLTNKKPCLSVGTGFVWDVPDTLADKGQSSESEDEEEDEAKKKKNKKMTKAEREAMAKQEEQRLHELERARLDKDRQPQTAMDYEELLQTSPNSSAVWIQFISFHLESAEMEKAKAVARRALQVINMREEQERLNIWTVILRLEVLYGTPETVQASYREALATNDEQQVHLAMAMVYAENDKIKDASNIYYIMTKKFGQVLDVWIKAGIFFFRNKKFDEARKYMDRALIALEKKYHVELINRFGQLEFKFGEAERGRTMFESLLSNYPKRIDVWSVYVDLLTKNGDIEGARTVLERMTGLKLKIRKMRGIFKKFLDFEKTHGTPQRVQAVKKQVEDFVAAAIGKE
ncbi:putative protein RRP5-like [Penaeus vannamei]|uniref:S1 motif domain-containing protein n=1 Tax=Penaeus vannamei TaxID=6689 RepID=A0A423SLE6_PENVA|nr:putative protein RRP5-like [Penaeus vannamei]